MWVVSKMEEVGVSVLDKDVSVVVAFALTLWFASTLRLALVCVSSIKRGRTSLIRQKSDNNSHNGKHQAKSNLRREGGER